MADALELPVNRGGALAALPEGLFQHIEQASGLGTWVWNPTTNQVAWSDQVHRIFGTDPAHDTPTFDSYVALLHSDDRDQILARARETVRTGGFYSIDHRIVRGDGEVREVHSKMRAEVDADGAVTYLAGSIQDVTAELRAGRALAQARDLFAGVLDAATEQAIIGMDQSGVITVFNRGAERMLGYSAAELVGAATPVVLHDPDELAQRAAEGGVAPDFRLVVGRAADGHPETRQWTYLTKDGRRLQAMITATAMRDEDRQITGFIQVATDLTARYVAERALQASEALFQDIFDNAASGILLADISDGAARMLRVNPAMSRITGYTEQQLLGMTVFDLTHPESIAAANERLKEYFADGAAPMEAERRWIHADGRDIWVQLNISATRRDQPDSVVTLVEDITARKLAEDRLSHLALHDALTGLPNRRLLLDRLQHALDSTVRSGRPAGVLYLDLDGFKGVNDQAGHLVGDEILQIVAQRLVANVRPGDTVARMGGDEFVVVCPELADPEDVGVVARRLLHHLALPYPHAGAVHKLSTSIGIASSTPGVSAQTLVREADAAMYLAKKSGRNRIRSADRSPESAAETVHAAQLHVLEAEMRLALEREEFVLYGQPIVDLDSGRVTAVEMSFRWQHPEHGAVLPADVLDLTDTSLRIGRRTLEQACLLAVQWPQRTEGGPAVHVDISGRQLAAGTLATEVRAALASSGLPANRLVLELRETALPLITGPLLAELTALREAGIRMAVDGVGTGEVSLERLTTLPIDVVKIDAGVTADVGQDIRRDAVVRAMVSVGDTIGVQVIAEGVETAGQAAALRRYGCRWVQGSASGPARPAGELLELLGDPRPVGWSGR